MSFKGIFSDIKVNRNTSRSRSQSHSGFDSDDIIMVRRTCDASRCFCAQRHGGEANGRRYCRTRGRPTRICSKEICVAGLSASSRPTCSNVSTKLRPFRHACFPWNPSRRCVRVPYLQYTPRIMAPASRSLLTTLASSGTMDFRRENDPAVVFKPSSQMQPSYTTSMSVYLTFRGHSGNIILEQDWDSMQQGPWSFCGSLCIKCFGLI